MFVRIAQRIGGFAGTTAKRWMQESARSAPVPLPTPSKPTLTERAAKPAVAAVGTLAALVAVSRATRLREMLADGLRRRAEDLRSQPKLTSTSSSNGNGNGSKDMSEKTRAELYELAKEAGIAGRSQMTKEELAKALSD